MDIKLKFEQARKLKQRIIIVEKLIELYEIIEFEKLEIYNGIPTDFIKKQINPYIKYSPIESMYFGIPSAILSSLTFQSDARAIERHIKRLLKDGYEKALKVQIKTEAIEAVDKSIYS